MWAVWAAEAPAGGDVGGLPGQWETLGQLGLAGLVIACLGWFALAAWKRETARGDRLEEENRGLNSAMQEKAIPALVTAVAAITECTELMRELQRDRERERDYQRREQRGRDGDPR
jgi:hypothetical protein